MRAILKWRPEITAARVAVWALLAGLAIDVIQHPNYWNHQVTATELVLLFVGAVAALIDLYEMLTLETVVSPYGHRQRLWFPSKEQREALGSGLAINFEEFELVSPETWTKLLRGEIGEDHPPSPSD
jgi:hypothetical protein